MNQLARQGFMITTDRYYRNRERSRKLERGWAKFESLSLMSQRSRTNWITPIMLPPNHSILEKFSDTHLLSAKTIDLWRNHSHSTMELRCRKGWSLSCGKACHGKVTVFNELNYSVSPPHLDISHYFWLPLCQVYTSTFEGTTLCKYPTKPRQHRCCTTKTESRYD
jgi:hypothetical protein